MTVDPVLDLVFERLTEAPPALVWTAWTDPEQLKQWFTPAPWTTVACAIDLRPGGRFATTMRSPEGADMPNEGCYLEVEPERRLTWTSALGPDFRPIAIGPNLPFHFTATIVLEPHGAGTKYTAIVRHGDQAARDQHEAMGFHDGWGAAWDQLVALLKR
ncbi:MAG: SRPBCC family protein [Deltaproteobacteria bacterium]|nr:SRPBCC family protein [Deltaproteobacteria bacterium]